MLFLIYIYYNRLNNKKVVKRFNKWNYIDIEELTKIKKGIVGNKRDFLKSVEVTFTPYYQPLIPYINRL